MAKEWERAEILLEGLKKDIKAVAEGHSILLQKIDESRSELTGMISDLTLITKDIGRDLREHIRQTVPPAHVAV